MTISSRPTLWDSSDDTPYDMPISEFETRTRNLLALAPHAWRETMRARLEEGSDHTGPTAHPYDAGQLHVWELYLMERSRAGKRRWMSVDGFDNMLAPADADPNDAAAAVNLRGPVARVWFQEGRDDPPFRFTLVARPC